jgi:hypothetical protein
MAELTDVARELNKLPDVTRKAIAAIALGKKADVKLVGKGAECCAAVKRALEGPYGEQLLSKLQAIHNAVETSDSKGRKAIGVEVD